MYTDSVGVAPVSSAGQVGTTGAPGRRATPFCYAPSPSRASRSHLGRTGASKVSAGTWLVPAPVGVRQRPCHPRTRGKRNKQNKAAIMVANAACRSAAIGLRYIRSREGGGVTCANGKYPWKGREWWKGRWGSTLVWKVSKVRERFYCTRKLAFMWSHYNGPHLVGSPGRGGSALAFTA